MTITLTDFELDILVRALETLTISGPSERFDAEDLLERLQEV